MKNKNILIVDDRPENIFTLEHILNNNKRNFIKASTGMEALMLATVEQVDVILLDFNLEDISGLEVAQKLRENDITKDIPIIFVTALNKSERKKAKRFEPGTIDFIFKPIDIDEAQNKLAVFERMVELQNKLKENNLV